MTIPINKTYQFTIKVLEEDSFNPQDLTSLTSAELVVIDNVTNNVVFTVNSSDITSTVGHWSIDSSTQTTEETKVVVTDANSLELSSSISYITTAGTTAVGVTVDTTTQADTPAVGSTTTTTITNTTVATQTGVLTFTVEAATTSTMVETRGDAVDDYYLKSGYRGAATLVLTNRPDINITINKISAIKVS